MTDTNRNRPLIGINADLEEDTNKVTLKKDYLDRIREAGGVPLLITPGAGDEELEMLVELADGFLFTGGNDLNPAHYGEELTDHVEPVPESRERTDLLLIKKALSGTQPIFGVCYGMQLLNVACGGDLYQDITDQVTEAEEHRSSDDDDTRYHNIKVKKGSLLHRILQNTDLEVNTSHHQAVRTPGEGLRIVAESDDGIIEGVELEESDRFCIGVQWHPERMPDHEETRILFESFIKECQK